jgi:hypothetical protein
VGVGGRVGVGEGGEVGVGVGGRVGEVEGDGVGEAVGGLVGVGEGGRVGTRVGGLVGVGEGGRVGTRVGGLVGEGEGGRVGARVGGLVGPMTRNLLHVFSSIPARPPAMVTPLVPNFEPTAGMALGGRRPSWSMPAAIRSKRFAFNVPQRMSKSPVP